MSKKYSPTKWVANKTVATADVMNNIEGGINDVNDDICESSTSGDLLNENVNSFKVGTGSINGENKDFTNQMEQSIVTLDDIQGKTVKEHLTLLSREIYRLYSSSFPKITDIRIDYPGTSLNIQTGEVKVNENYYVSQHIKIEPNTLYLFENIDANICFYDANGIFISNYDNSHNDNFHIFGYYGLHRYSFYVITPKNASTVRCTVHNNANPSIVRVKDYYEPKITLSSLPNGVCDEIKNGELIQRVSSVIDMSTLDWRDSGTNSQFPSSSYVVYWCPAPNVKCTSYNLNGDYKVIDSTHFEAKPFCYTASCEDDDEYNTACISTDNQLSEIRVKLPRHLAPNVNAFKEWCATGNICYLQYQFNKPIVTPIVSSILTNSNDTINIDTPVPITCTHKVSLNTKSQVEELQEVVQKEKKSVLQKFKELTDVKIELNENGYLKFPSILGGLTIQWVSNTVTGNSYKSFGLPISFDNNVLYYIGTLTGEVPGNSVVTFGDVSKSGFKAKHTVNNNTLTFKAFFIGY